MVMIIIIPNTKITFVNVIFYNIIEEMSTLYKFFGGLNERVY